jgi:hypothetical protein
VQEESRFYEISEVNCRNIRVVRTSEVGLTIGVIETYENFITLLRKRENNNKAVTRTILMQEC